MCDCAHSLPTTLFNDASPFPQKDSGCQLTLKTFKANDESITEGRLRTLTRRTKPQESHDSCAPELALTERGPGPCVQVPSSFPLLGGVRLSLGVPCIQILSLQDTGTDSVPSMQHKEDRGAPCPKGILAQGFRDCRTFGSCTQQEKYSRQLLMPRGSSLGFAEFSRR